MASLNPRKAMLFTATFGCLFVLIVNTSFSIRSGKIHKPGAHGGWVKLLDNNLSQWGTYLSFSHRADYTGKKPVDEKGQEIAPVGYNKDPKNVFSVQYERGQPVLHISGEIYGCVYTKQDYENFHLKLKMKWGNTVYGPRVGKLKDSGILYFSQGDAGVDYWRSWMLAQEFQMMPGHTGDYWNIANSAVDIRAYLSEGKMNSVADAAQPFLGFGTGCTDGLCLRSGNYEKPVGEWNTIELICYKGQSLHIVNGHVVMVLKNSRYIVNGKAMPLTKGKIQLQSEGSEVYYKDIEVENIKALPAQYKALYN